jgi:hypothetical protein
MKNVRMAMLGSGFVADFYMQGLADVAGQEVVVAFAPPEYADPLRQFAADWHIAETSTDFNRTMVSKPNLLDAHPQAPKCAASAQGCKSSNSKFTECVTSGGPMEFENFAMLGAPRQTRIQPARLNIFEEVNGITRHFLVAALSSFWCRLPKVSVKEALR